MDKNLKETGITIQVIIEGMPNHPFQHQINKGEGEMIIPSGYI